jgi:nitrous oxidase accessory protein
MVPMKEHNISYYETRFGRLVLLLTLLFVCMILSLPDAHAQTGRDTLVVDPDGTIPTLSEALELVQPGQVIALAPGRYIERDVDIKTPNITITSLDPAHPGIVDAEGEGHTLMVHANGVTIRDMGVYGSGRSFMRDNAGIVVEESKDITIQRVKMERNFFGIYLAKSRNVRLIDNHIQAYEPRETMSGNGIHLWYSKHIRIEDNTITGHRDGIYFEFVDSSQVKNNLSYGNLRYGLHFMFSNDCGYTANTFRDNGAGVAVMYTDRVQMHENHFEDNWGSAAYGLLLKEIRYSEISHNWFTNNSVGVYAEASSHIKLHHNRFQQNGWAVKIMGNCVDNTFTQNDFIANTFDVATNSMQQFNHFNGNYWSQYEGYDLDRDGIGDIPYHPVRMFAMLVEQQPPAMILLRSILVELLDKAERLLPVMTPETLVDEQPKMRSIL